MQVPTPPLAGAALASHGSGSQTVRVSVPREQLVLPDAVYPVLHVGWQLDPLDISTRTSMQGHMRCISLEVSEQSL